MSPSYEMRNGQMVQVPDVHITQDAVIDQSVTRTMIVEAGARATTTGNVSGTVAVKNGELVAKGNVSGTVSVDAGCTATFHQQMSGTLNVARGGTARLLPGAVALGTLKIDGSLVNEGVRCVSVSGAGQIEDRGTGRVRQPDEVTSNGAVIYRS